MAQAKELFAGLADLHAPDSAVAEGLGSEELEGHLHVFGKTSSGMTFNEGRHIACSCTGMVREIDERMFCILSDGEAEELAEILTEGADPNAVDDCDRPAIDQAYFEPEMVRFLIDAGANVHVRVDGYIGNKSYDDLTLIESLIGDLDEKDLRKSGHRYAATLVLLLEAGVDPIVRMDDVPDIFADLLAPYASAKVLGDETPEAAAPARATRL